MSVRRAAVVVKDVIRCPRIRGAAKMGVLTRDPVDLAEQAAHHLYAVDTGCPRDLEKHGD